MNRVPSTSSSRPWLAPVIVGVLLGVHAIAAVDSARRITVTHDEYWHLPVGFLNLTTGRFDLDTLNPPLIRMGAAVPLLFTSAKTGPADVEHKPGDYGNNFEAANHDDYFRLFWLGRLMIVLMSVATG